MVTPLLVALLIVNIALVALIVSLIRRADGAQQSNAILGQLANRLELLDRSLSDKFASARADMADRLQQTKGDLRQEVADRLNVGLKEVRDSVDQHLATGRREQTDGLAAARNELTASLTRTTSELKREFQTMNEGTARSLDAIRSQVDQKLMAISDQVQQKLSDNMREGFAHFEKVQQHLKAAEEQLREVSTIGASINDLNNLLKLPHLRGQFGEASLERLLADFLPAHMYELQASPTDDRSRADAVIRFPDRNLPIDAKFPREQVLALFESSEGPALDHARTELVRVLKVEAKRIAGYIQPEQGTMDIALMYLPSETLYLEAIRSAEASDALSKQRVFPVSPNTLLMTLKTISLAYRWYEVAARFEETRRELGRAQKSLEHFQGQFETIGKNLERAQDAYDVAAKHLKTYRGRVATLTGEEGAQLELPSADGMSKAQGSGK